MTSNRVAAGIVAVALLANLFVASAAAIIMEKNRLELFKSAQSIVAEEHDARQGLLAP